MIGRSLAHFKITGLLGEGGMGAVYRALDTRLDRGVAVKVLPEALVADPERLARLEREAKALAALDHPGIVRIYSLETIDRTDGEGPLTFLVMELVEGETLEEEIPSGGMSLERFFALAVPIAETVEAAHLRGIVHRDLKPANIMVTPDRGIKILDFGLAKRATPDASLDVVDGEAPTRTRQQLTEENQLVGTGPYMSPEQIRSRPLDARSDIFSLGVVLYEMLAAERPFAGETSIDLISSILREEPRDLADVRPEVPKRLRRLIERCLAKNPSGRFDSASHLARRLRALTASALEPEETDEAARQVEETAAAAGELDPRAVAVLPFANLSGTEEAAVLATGLHNDVLTELSRIPGLTVISRTSVIAYEKSTKPVTAIGRELRVGTIVEGTVQSAGNRVRLTAQLIDAAEDVQRWAERYDRELSTETLFDLQSEVTRRIVDSLQSELAPTLELPRGRPGTHDMEAYRLTTLGRVQHERRTETGCRRAIGHFESAVERDPDYASAWAGLGEALAIAVWYRYLATDGRLERAEKAARRAVELDPESAEAHCALATCFGAVRNGPAAMRELETAVELQPSYWDAYNRLSYLNHLHGNAPQALESAERSVELNPLSPEAVSNLSLSLLTNRDPERALVEARHAGELSPGWTTAPFYEALPLLELGRHEKAVNLLSGLDVEWAGLGAQATLALTYVRAGDEASARAVLEAMDPGFDAFAVGFAHLALSETERAFERFSAARELTDWACLAIHHLYADTWEPVRDEPRFRELVARAYRAHGLEPPGEGS